MYKYPHFNNMRQVGKRTAECMELLSRLMKPGITAYDIDLFVKKFAEIYSLECPQFNYENPHLSTKPFPGHCCVSINDELCHGIPTEDKVFQLGDLVKVDLTFADEYGWHGDHCKTFCVGDKLNTNYLSAIGCMATMKGIAAVKAGRPISDIGKAIENFVTNNTKFFVNKDFCGHGIGQQFHMEPKIPHYYMREYDHKILMPGMMFTIEPMITESTNYYYTDAENCWTVYTENECMAVQFEHTIGIDEDGTVCIFTLT